VNNRVMKRKRQRIVGYLTQYGYVSAESLNRVFDHGGTTSATSFLKAMEADGLISADKEDWFTGLPEQASSRSFVHGFGRWPH